MSSSSSSSSSWREWRHSPCLMAPLTVGLWLVLGVVGLGAALLQLPVWIWSALLMAPLMRHSSPFALLVEFLYPSSLGKSIHFFLFSKIQASRFKGSSSNNNAHDKNRGFHSRTLEQRIAVIPNKIYIHCIPQFLDNVGYLVVCLPDGYRKDDDEISMNANESGMEVSAHNFSPLRKKEEEKKEATDYQQGTTSSNNTLVAFMIDCGDVESTQRAISMIQDYWYPNTVAKPPKNDESNSKNKKKSKKQRNARPPTYNLEVQAIASTHKHHDHTGGNRALQALHPSIITIYGGAVEKVPGCTSPVVNGQLLSLPRNGSNDMNDYIQVEVLALPSHTRGSVAYKLTIREAHRAVADVMDYVFTGDVLFSAGTGVPFEADGGMDSDRDVDQSTGNTPIRTMRGQAALERCAAEVLVRTTTSANNNRVLVFPGHEYTVDLLLAQFAPNPTADSLGGSAGEAIRKGWWKYLPPQDFFETVSQLYAAHHRRTLPHNSGRLLVVPTSLERELSISPVYRALRRHGEMVVRAIRFWHSNFCQDPIAQHRSDANGSPAGERDKQQDSQQRSTNRMSSPTREDALASLTNPWDEDASWDPSVSAMSHSKKTHQRTLSSSTANSKTHQRTLSASSVNSRNSVSGSRKWTDLNPSDIVSNPFTTMYRQDMEDVIYGLQTGRLSSSAAAHTLGRLMETGLSSSSIQRRPIPGVLPANKAIYRGVYALALLGSPPAALTTSDAQAMHIPEPLDSNSDRLLISKKRLFSVLSRMRIIREEEKEFWLQILDQLWFEARPYSLVAADQDSNDDTEQVGGGDLLELGVLKWIIYGVAANEDARRQGNSSSWCSLICRPCASKNGDSTTYPEDHPANNLKQRSGELVSHDILTCPLCRNAAGCPHVPGLLLDDGTTEPSPSSSSRWSRSSFLRSQETLSDLGTESDEWPTSRRQI